MNTQIIAEGMFVARSALDVVKSYIREAWNEGKVELISELCADPVIRHDANSVTELSHAEQVERIAHNFEELRPIFEEVVFAGDDEHITLIWNVTGRDPNWKWCGIEIFRVTNGKISEVWNSPYLDGRWGMSRRLASRQGGSPEMAMPIMTLDMTDTGAVTVIPVDARNIGRWLSQILGVPHTSAAEGGLWRHHYVGNEAAPFLLVMRDDHGPTRSLEAATVTNMRIEWARSGLINATVTAIGQKGRAPAEGSTLEVAPAVVRLAEPSGTFSQGAQCLGRVVDSIVEIGAEVSQPKGRVTLRVPAHYTATAPIGSGALSFGWRAGDFSLTFECTAFLGTPEGSFTDGDETEFSCAWQAESISATVVNDLEA